VVSTRHMVRIMNQYCCIQTNRQINRQTRTSELSKLCRSCGQSCPSRSQSLDYHCYYYCYYSVTLRFAEDETLCRSCGQSVSQTDIQSVSQSVTNKSILRIGNTIHHPSLEKRRKKPPEAIDKDCAVRVASPSVSRSVADTCTCYDFLSGYNRRRCTRTRTMRCDREYVRTCRVVATVSVSKM